MRSASAARSWVRDLWWLPPAMFVGIVGTLSSTAEGRPFDGVSDNPVGVALVVTSLGGLAVWRRWPEVSVAVNAAAVATYFAIGNPDGPIYLTVPAAALVIGLRRPPRRWLPYVSGAALVVAAGLLVRMLLGEADDPQTMWQIVGVTALTFGAAALGWALRNRQEARAELARRAATEEQLRMAQDLHDGVGHGLAVVAMQAGVALHVLDRDPAKARASLEAIRDTSREALDALRQELTRLSATEPGARTPHRGLSSLGVLAERMRAGGLPVEVTGDTADLPPAVDAAAYAIVQESLTNVLRHADATRATVRLDRDEETFRLAVTDDGREPAANPSPARQAPAGGLGIPGMRIRAEQVGGRLYAGPDGGGWSVRAEMPLGAP